jgi:hypothetical protein
MWLELRASDEDGGMEGFEFEVLTETRSAAGKRGRAALLLLGEQPDDRGQKVHYSLQMDEKKLCVTA